MGYGQGEDNGDGLAKGEANATEDKGAKATYADKSMTRPRLRP